MIEKVFVIDTGMIPIESTNWLPKRENNDVHMIIHDHGRRHIET